MNMQRIKKSKTAQSSEAVEKKKKKKAEKAQKVAKDIASTEKSVIEKSKKTSTGGDAIKAGAKPSTASSNTTGAKKKTVVKK